MKKLISSIFYVCLIINYSNGQLTWQKNGNNIGGGANPTIGTSATWNSPLINITFGINRTKLNQTLSYPINGLAALNRSGFFLVGQDGNLSGGYNDVFHKPWSIFSVAFKRSQSNRLCTRVWSPQLDANRYHFY